MNNVVYRVLADIGLIGWPPVFRDRWFVVALFSAFPVWVVLWFSVIPTFDIDDHSLAGVLVLSVIWYPVLEEVLFRGIVQGAIFYKQWGRKYFIGFSVANLLASLLFAFAHFWYQSVIWGVLIFVPSLVYGIFRDRYSSIYPGILLHAFYNGGFVGINIAHQLM